jgi:hypothetical protein
LKSASGGHSAPKAKAYCSPFPPRATIARQFSIACSRNRTCSVRTRSTAEVGRIGADIVQSQFFFLQRFRSFRGSAPDFGQ